MKPKRFRLVDLNVLMYLTPLVMIGGGWYKKRKTLDQKNQHYFFFTSKSDWWCDLFGFDDLHTAKGAVEGRRRRLRKERRKREIMKSGSGTSGGNR